jgi:hypothetical protein
MMFDGPNAKQLVEADNVVKSICGTVDDVSSYETTYPEPPPEYL